MMVPLEQHRNKEIENQEADDCQNGVFDSVEEMKMSLTRLCNGDLYIIGRIYIEALKTVLVGSNFCLIPAVKADKPPPQTPPQKPPQMGYKDLPIYQSPHYDYKNYLEEKEKCPEARIKLIHRYLYPHVQQARIETAKQLREVRCALDDAYKNVCSSISTTKNDIKSFMRDPEKLAMRQGVVAAGAATGFLLGSSGGIPKKLFWTSLGGLAAGALCFPRETDEIFRNSLYYGTQAFQTLYHKVCNKNANLKERLPIEEDVSNPPSARNLQCPIKK